MASPADERDLAVDGPAQPPSSDAATPARDDLGLAAGVARSGIWSVAGQLSILLVTLIATPFTIRLLGPARYGVCALLTTVFAYFRLADIGMTTASTKFAAERYADDDGHGEAAVIWTALAVTTALTGAAALAASIVAPFLVSDVLHIGGHLRSDTIVGFRLIAAASVAYAVMGVSNTPQQVRLHWGRLTLATSGPAALQVAITPVVLAVTAGGVIAVAAVVLLSTAAAAIANFAVAVRLLPVLHRPHVQAWAVRPLAKYGAWLAVSGFVTLPLTSADRFFLAHYRSSTQVAYYAVAASLGAVLTIIPAAVSQPMLPALTRLTSEGRHDEHRRLYHQILRGVFLVTTPTALTMAFLARPFLGLWAGHIYAIHSVTAFDIILAGLWLNTLGVTPYYQLLVSGRTATVALIRLAELIPYLIIAAVLSSAFGVIGAATAWSLRIAVDGLLFFVIPTRSQRLPWTLTPQRAGGSLAAVVALAACLLALSQVTASLPTRAGWSILMVVFYAATTWKLVLVPDERAGLTSLIQSIVPRHRATT